MSDSAVLDVVLGLSFLFFVLSLVCATVNELLAAAFKLRANNLAAAIAVLLDGRAEADAFYEHPLIRALYRGGRRPSYVPAHRFAQVVVDRYAPALLPPGTAPDFSAAPSLQVRATLKLLWADAAGDAAAFRYEVERWFDDTMKRATGWYRRRTQLVLLGLAVVATVALNVNAIAVTQRLWTDAPLRAAVAGTSVAPAPAPGQDGVAELQREYARSSAARLPLGWSSGARPSAWWTALGGWLVTVLSVTLGAPFWFDLLSRFARLRSAGQREDPK